MTLRGKRNHYNVKFLHGYGASISMQKSKIILKDGINPFTDKQDSESWFVSNMPYEKIVLSGKGYISTEALSLINQRNRNVLLVDTFGKPVSFCNGMIESLTATKYRMGQYDTFRNPAKCLCLSKQIIKAKIESQIKFLEHTGEDIDTSKLKPNLKSLDQMESPITNEAKVSRIYFREYAKLFDKSLNFESRNQSHIRISKNRATDIVNSLLNYGYTVLAGEISKYVNGIGLDAYYGFHHKTHTGFQPLVYDLIEPFRWLVDYSVWKLTKADNNKFSKKKWAHLKNGSIIMEPKLIRTFLELLERTFQKKRRYAFRHGEKTNDGLKQCQEITIAKIAVQNLADYCIGKQKEFRI